MDMIVWALIGLVLVIALIKLRATYRSVRTNREQEIQEELARLRKKRDED